MEYSILESEKLPDLSRNISYLNENLELVKENITPENAPDFLVNLKNNDLEKYNVGQPTNSLDLRREIMIIRAGIKLDKDDNIRNILLNSYDVFSLDQTFDIEKVDNRSILRCKFDKAGLSKFVRTGASWLPERKAYQEELIKDEMDRVEDMSNRLKKINPEPTVYAMRGNTATGKTFNASQNEFFRAAIDDFVGLQGAINPDSYKTTLKNDMRENGQHTIPQQFIHFEGSAIADAIKNRLRDDHSFLIDQRMSDYEDVLSALALAKDRKLVMIDIESPFELSLLRVLHRKTYGLDPCADFGAIESGYKRIRKHRENIFKEALENPQITNYYLYVNDGQNSDLAFKKEKDDIRYMGQEEHFDMVDLALNDQTEDEIEKIASTVIDDDYIENIQKRIKIFNENVLKSLEEFKGLTIKQAIEKKATTLNEETPTAEQYMDLLDTNMRNTSRTFSGIISGGEQIGKAEIIAEKYGSMDEAAKKRLTIDNYNVVSKYIYDQKDREFRNPADLRKFIERINMGLTWGKKTVDQAGNGILLPLKGVKELTQADWKNYPKMRQKETKYLATKVKDLDESYDEFFDKFFEKLNDSSINPIELAAWAEYHVDIRDHFYEDGCGRTAKLVSAWVSMRYGLPLPDYTCGGKINKTAEKLYNNLENKLKELTDKPENEQNNKMIKKFADFVKKKNDSTVSPEELIEDLTRHEVRELYYSINSAFTPEEMKKYQEQGKYRPDEEDEFNRFLNLYYDNFY